MAKSLLKKHFGIGGKKGPPHPPKPDYVTQKSSSVQELLSRSPTSDHKSSASLTSAASHIGSFEVAQLADSPSRSSRLSQSSLASTLGFGGARSKEPKEASSAASPKDKHSSVSGCDEETQDSPVEEPTLLDEYSDPFDLKKQIQDTGDLLGACAPATAQAIAEDDYSVPYEVKKMMKEKKARENDKGHSPGGDGKAGSPHGKGSPSKSNNVHAMDRRPHEEYDEPWEWSQTHSMIFDQMANNDTGTTGSAGGGSTSGVTGQNRSTPLMTKRTAGTTESSGDTNVQRPGFGTIVAEAEASIANMSLMLKEEEERQEAERIAQAEGGVLMVQTISPDVEEVIEDLPLPSPPPPLEEADLIEVIDDPLEYENMKDDYLKPLKPPEKPPEMMNEEEYERYTQLREEQHTARRQSDGVAIAEPSRRDTQSPLPPPPVQCPENDRRGLGNYEEPWDLERQQRAIEDRIKAHVSAAGTSGGTVTVTNDDDDVGVLVVTPQLGGDDDAAVVITTATMDGSGTSPENADGAMPGGSRSGSRSRTSPADPPVIPDGDKRPQEGYEKPWDWKPHKKDDRGQEGYEKPWDWKPHQKDDRPGEEYEQPWDHKVQNIEDNLKKAKGPGGHTDNLIEKLDQRPTDEYEEPWDQKQKAMLNRTESGGLGPSTSAAGGSNQRKPPHDLNLSATGWGAKAERIDPKLPLDQQGWYHGAISRVDAEALLRLRTHKEGSYLVRMSESNKMDYSLSLKSARGFMHMKIVHRDKRFILGQFSQPFDTIPLMIHHYSVNKLPIKGAEHMSLLYPVMHELL